MRVLIVDDGIGPDDPLVQYFRLAGLAVSCAGTGLDGVRLATSLSLDAVLLDLVLPDISGFTVLGKLRDVGVTVPIVVVTGCVLDGEREAKRLGAAGFLVKPLDADALLALVRQVARRPTRGGPARFAERERARARAQRRQRGRGPVR